MHQRARTASPALARNSQKTPQPAAPHGQREEILRNARETAKSTATSWDIAKVSLPPRGMPVQPHQLGKWARTLASAPETRPGDTAERDAERDADAAMRNDTPLHMAAVFQPQDPGLPPWGDGRRLSRDERNSYGPHLERNFESVRIHEGAAPAQWARLLGARAFTLGRHIVMGSGEYAPDSPDGRHLLAHELSHAIRSGGQMVLARVSLSAADFDALADSIHNAISAAASDKELIYVALQKLERDATAISSLLTAYKRKFTSDLSTDLASKLSGRGLDLANVLLALKGGITLATAPAKPADYEAAARAIHTALTAQTADAESTFAALLPLGRDKSMTATLRTTYKSLFSASDLDSDITTKLAGAAQSYALYLLNGPLPATPHAPANIPTQPSGGTPPATAPPAAPGGTVTAETRVPYTTTKGDSATFGFGVGYSGALSADTRMIQFIEREIDYDPAGGGARVALDKEIEASSGAGKYKYRLTTSAASPQWNVDSSDSANPFYDETHSSSTWRQPTSVAIYDAPNSREKSEVTDLFNAGNKNVTSRAHFEIYMIRDFSAIYCVGVEITWVFSAPGTMKINRTVRAAGPVSAMPPQFKTALAARYPAFSYIR